LAPGGSGSVWKYIEALVRSPGVSGRIACGSRTELHFADEAGLPTREPEKTFEEMLNAIGDSLSDLASTDDEEDAEDEEEDDNIEQGKLSEDDEPSWVMGSISNMV